jgi:hypothetical protein
MNSQSSESRSEERNFQMFRLERVAHESGAFMPQRFALSAVYTFRCHANDNETSKPLFSFFFN